MPDKNVQLPDGRVVAFPDSMADADISAVIKKQLGSTAPQSTIPENYGFTAHHMAAQGMEGIKQLGSSLYGMGKDILFPEGETEADKLKFLAHKYITDPADREQILARNAKTPWESLGHSIAQSIPLVGPWAASIGEQAGTGDVGGALAKGGTQVAAVKAAPAILKGGKVVAGMARESIGAKIHTPEGDLTPGAQLTGKAGGGLVGSTVGATLHEPVAGFFAGKELGPSLLDRMFPEPKNAAEARSQAKAYQAKAEDLMRRGREQEALDRKAARDAKLKAKSAPAPSPFPNATPTSTPTGNAELPAIPQGNPTLFPTVQKLSDLKGQPSGRIVSPESSPPDVKVTYQSVPKTELLKKVMTGDKFAIDEWKRRGLDLPDNVKYMTEDAGPKPWRNYRR